MATFKNIFLCLVHEKPDCIVDLVRNLRYFDPESDIILYNGSNNILLLNTAIYEWYGAEVYPNPKSKRWGWLHDFAIDGMRHAIATKDFDTITIVDSDQLLLKEGYSEMLQKELENVSNIGMLGNNHRKQTGFNISPVSAHAIKEKELWLPLLQTLPGGTDAFLYWSFWPSTVFTKAACKELVTLFDTNEGLKQILEKTSIWASEEVILPTLVKALGFDIAENPSRYDYVQYKKNYTTHHIQRGINTPNIFWMHPVPRDAQNELRKFILKNGNYYVPQSAGVANIYKEINKHISGIKGWLTIHEAELLMETTDALLQQVTNPVIVEIGSYCGKSTCAIGLTGQKTNKKLQLYAIDPFEGLVGAADDKLQTGNSTYTQFMYNIEQAGLKDYVITLKAKSGEVRWNKPIDFLFIDGLHDYFNVANDFLLFNRWVKKGGYIAFHDYADYYQGVKSLVAEVVKTGEYKLVALKDTMIVVEKLIDALPQTLNENTEETKEKIITPSSSNQIKVTHSWPLVSCITPTYNRPELLRQSISLFLQQEYENKELIIIDDSSISQQYSNIVELEAVKHIFFREKQTIGEKRNTACEYATGEIIVHWDDDDWYTPQWIKQQVLALQKGNTKITGLDKPFFYSEKLNKAWQYIYPENEKKWVYGATLAYWKSVWQSHPFSKINIGEDNMFVWQGSQPVVAHNFVEGYLGRIHIGNTSPKYTASKRWEITDMQNINPILEAAKILPAIAVNCMD